MSPEAAFSELDRHNMELALEQAALASTAGEVPVGAVLTDADGRVLAQDYNRSITAADPTAHAEMLCMRAAAQAVGNYRLVGTTLYVTLEPCPMCAGAAVWARVARVVFGAADPKAGAYGSALDLGAVATLNHHPLVQGGLMADRAARLLSEFFAARR